jgi:hypothetical protein
VSKRKVALLLIGVAALAGIVVLLIGSLGGDDPDGLRPTRAQPPGGEGLAPAPRKAMRLPPVKPGRSPGQAPVPAAVQQQELDPMEVAEPPPPEVLEKQRTTLRAKAQKQQVTLYQQQLLALDRQIARLRQTLKRLKQEGSSSPEQIAQIERRLQQMIDAEPRMRGRLRELEREAQKQAQQQAQEPARGPEPAQGQAQGEP